MPVITVVQLGGSQNKSIQKEVTVADDGTITVEDLRQQLGVLASEGIEVCASGIHLEQPSISTNTRKICCLCLHLFALRKPLTQQLSVTLSIHTPRAHAAQTFSL